MKLRHGLLAAGLVGALGASPAASQVGAPVARASAVCADYPNQAAAQRAGDTLDPDGDGIYCESLPCPCSSASGGGGSGGGQDGGTNPAGFTRPGGVQRLVFSATKYRHIRAHFRAAVRRGWPRRLVVNRPGADERRDRLLEGYPTRAALTATSTRPRSGGGEAPACGAAATPADGGPTCATWRAGRTARTVPRWAAGCGRTATARDSATCSARSRAREAGLEGDLCVAGRSA